MRLAAALTICLLFSTSAWSADSDVTGRLDVWLTASGYSGSALVVRNGTVLLRKGYPSGPGGRSTERARHGVHHRLDHEAVHGRGDPQARDAGAITVEDPIAKHLPGVPEDKRGIAIHHLLTHTAGFESDFAGDYDPVGRDEYVQRVLGSKMRSAPGTAYHYANSGYSLLGAIIEIVSGQPYETYLRDNLFFPAPMKDTGYRVPGRSVDREAVGYDGQKRWGRLSEKPWADDGPYW